MAPPPTSPELQLCGEIQVIQEDVPLRTPRDVVGKLVPLRKSAATGSAVSSFSIQLECQHEEGNDSDEISGGSFERGLSSAERQLHESVLFSCGDSNASDESSSDDEKLGKSSQVERSRLEDSISPIQFSKGVADACSGITKRSQILRRKYYVNQLRDASRAFWPSWVYQMYDAYSLAIKAADRCKKVVKAPNLDNIVMKPNLLSFHIASKLPLSESSRQELLEIDGTSYRLRREIELLDSFNKLKCKACLTLVAKRSDMLVMSSDGPLGAYANPHGFVHEVMTLVKTTAIGVTGRPVKEYSWFPGYAWSMTECMICGAHMSWYFTATRKNMKPQ